MLDVMSSGRLEVAFPLGTGMEYWANPVNPATAREKFRESLKIILQAWTDDGPTTHYGTHYTYRFLNPWPRPMQRPHPPCYIVGTGSPETIEIAAELRLRLRLGVRHPGARARAQPEPAQARQRFRPHHPAGPVSAADASSMWRRPRSAREQEYMPHLQVVLRGLPAHHAAISRAARLSLGRSAQDPRRRRRQDAWRLRFRRCSARRSSSRSARRKRSPISSAIGPSG